MVDDCFGVTHVDNQLFFGGEEGLYLTSLHFFERPVVDFDYISRTSQLRLEFGMNLAITWSILWKPTTFLKLLLRQFNFVSEVYYILFFTVISLIFFNHFWVLLSYLWGYNEILKRSLHTHNLCQHLFWKYSPTYWFLILPHLGPFFPFGDLQGFFEGWGQVHSFFWDHLCRLSAWVFEVHPYLFVFNFAQFGVLFPICAFSGLFLGGAATSICNFFRSFIYLFFLPSVRSDFFDIIIKDI